MLRVPGEHRKAAGQWHTVTHCPPHYWVCRLPQTTGDRQLALSSNDWIYMCKDSWIIYYVFQTSKQMQRKAYTSGIVHTGLMLRLGWWSGQTLLWLCGHYGDHSYWQCEAGTTQTVGWLRSILDLPIKNIGWDGTRRRQCSLLPDRLEHQYWSYSGGRVVTSLTDRGVRTTGLEELTTLHWTSSAWVSIALSIRHRGSTVPVFKEDMSSIYIICSYYFLISEEFV